VTRVVEFNRKLNIYGRRSKFFLEIKGVKGLVRRPWCSMLLAGVSFSLLLALLLSFSLSPAHISLVYGEEGPLIRMSPHTDDPYWLSVIGFTGWFVALGGFSLLGLGGLSFFFRRMVVGEVNRKGREEPEP
jgi:hypothetical protein